MTITQLRNRWKDPSFVEGLTVPRDRNPTSSELRGLDLRGVPKIGIEPPLENFSILLSEADSIDFSLGDGCFNICGSKASKLRFEKFKFTDAAFFSKSTFKHCNFQQAHFCFDLIDCNFIDCMFDGSTFSGKQAEYGFTRCSFTRCSFLNAKWKQTYFKAVTFDGCDMSQFQVIDSFATVINNRACINFWSFRDFYGYKLSPPQWKKITVLRFS